jgi:lauroyl/myristoyl acyltransferase
LSFTRRGARLLSHMKKIVNPLAISTIWLAELCRYVPVSWIWWISAAYGMLMYWTHKGRKREVERAYKRLCERAGISASPELLTRKFFRRQFMEMACQYIFQTASERRWAKGVVFEGLEQVAEAAKRGEGVIVCTMHFGTNVLSFARLEQQGFQIVAMRPAFMNRITDRRLRRMLFIHDKTVFVGNTSGLASPLRESIRWLKRNAVLGIAIDGDQGTGLTHIPVFGGPYPIRRGGLEIARLSRAPMIFAIGAVHDHRFRIRWFPAVDFSERGTEQETIDRFLKSCIQHFEEMIREYPECVWWTRPMTEALGLKKPSDDADDDMGEV